MAAPAEGGSGVGPASCLPAALLVSAELWAHLAEDVYRTVHTRGAVTPWSPEEVALLKAAFAELGPDFRAITARLHSRTINQVRAKLLRIQDAEAAARKAAAET